ncbi:MAG: HAMP domain-containing histidine kinase [bacterium]|nr:HAMP domain-containing histidine kinase [bacterium]
MKLKYRILFPVISVYIILYAISSFFIIETSHKRFLKNEITRITNLSSNSSQQILHSLELGKIKLLQELFDRWKSHYSSQNISFILLSDRQKPVFYTIERPEDFYSKEDDDSISWNSKHYIDKKKDNVYLISEEYITIPDFGFSKYKLIIVENITQLYKNRTRLFFILSIIGIGVVVLFLIFTGIILNDILKPLKDLTLAATSLKEGTYSALPKNPLLSDELVILCESFNNMALQIENQMKLLKDENKKKQHFINSLTHELNTPLTSIIGHADLILSTVMSKENQIESLLTIFDEGKRMRSMIDQLFLLIMDQTLKTVECSSDGLLLDIKNIWDFEAQKRGVKIQTEGESFQIIGNKDLLHVAIGNFIHNGIKAAGASGSVFIKQSRVNRTISISDTGSGVSEKTLSSINTPFYRGDEVHSDRGLGLGISIADEILKQHGFMLELIQKPMAGLEVTIFFNIYNSETK